MRRGLQDAIVVGGYENVYQACTKTWMLHMHLVVIGGEVERIEEFSGTFKDNGILRPVLTVPLKDLPEQLSYVLKFTTYHRPFEQQGPEKSPAVPLNRREHCELVSWRSQWEFKDYLFLFNVRREGSRIHPSPKDHAPKYQPL
jgi:hypothetical protein